MPRSGWNVMMVVAVAAAATGCVRQPTMVIPVASSCLSFDANRGSFTRARACAARPPNVAQAPPVITGWRVLADVPAPRIPPNPFPADTPTPLLALEGSLGGASFAIEVPGEREDAVFEEPEWGPSAPPNPYADVSAPSPALAGSLALRVPEGRLDVDIDGTRLRCEGCAAVEYEAGASSGSHLVDPDPPPARPAAAPQRAAPPADTETGTPSTSCLEARMELREGGPRPLAALVLENRCRSALDVDLGLAVLEIRAADGLVVRARGRGRSTAERVRLRPGAHVSRTVRISASPAPARGLCIDLGRAMDTEYALLCTTGEEWAKAVRYGDALRLRPAR